MQETYHDRFNVGCESNKGNCPGIQPKATEVNVNQLRLRPSRRFENKMNTNVWFIPGITGRARCLDDVPTLKQPVLVHFAVVKRTAPHDLTRLRRPERVTSAPSSSLDTLRDSSWSWPCSHDDTTRRRYATRRATVRNLQKQLPHSDEGIPSNSLDEHLALFRNSSWINPFDPDPEGSTSEWSPQEMTTVSLMPLLVRRKTSRHTISHKESSRHASTTTSVPLAKESPLAIRLRNVLSRIEAATSA